MWSTIAGRGFRLSCWTAGTAPGSADRPVVFAFHGYQRAIHEIVHGHVNADRFHMRGFNEQVWTDQ